MESKSCTRRDLQTPVFVSIARLLWSQRLPPEKPPEEAPEGAGEPPEEHPEERPEERPESVPERVPGTLPECTGVVFGDTMPLLAAARRRFTRVAL